MDKIYQAIADLINNGTIFLWAVVLFLIIEPLKKLLRLVGGWISVGSNTELLRRFLPPLEVRLDSKLEDFDLKFNTKFNHMNEKIEYISQLLEKMGAHKHNNKAFKQSSLQSLNQEDLAGLIKTLIQKLDEKN